MMWGIACGSSEGPCARLRAPDSTACPRSAVQSVRYRTLPCRLAGLPRETALCLFAMEPKTRVWLTASRPLRSRKPSRQARIVVR